MDSVTQFLLGASVGLLVSPVKNRKIALTSGILATLPDLDILIDYGDDLQNIIHHRGFSHSFLILTLASLPFAHLLKRLLPRLDLSFWRWFWLCFTVLNTHILLDGLTIFGTQIFWPSTAPSVMVGSMFIVDLFYTTPLLFAFLILMKQRRLPKIFGVCANTCALSLSGIYLVLALLLQQYALANTPPPNTEAKQYFAMPTPSNLLIWRVVYIDNQASYERFYNILTDKHTAPTVIAHYQSLAPFADQKINQYIAHYHHFSHGFYRLEQKDGDLIIRDIRMGTTTMPIFGFKIATKTPEFGYQSIKPKGVRLEKFSFKRMFGDWS